MKNLEFHSYDDEIWCKYPDGHMQIITEHDIDFINELYDMIKEFHSEAFSLLQEIYDNSKPNLLYYKYVIVKRFIKCNFSKLDTTFLDIDSFGNTNYERVDCPLRGECQYEGKICMPIYNNVLTEREKKIALLWYQGLTKEEIAKEVYLSFDTINNHIRRIYSKLGVHDKAAFTKKMAADHLV